MGHLTIIYWESLVMGMLGTFIYLTGKVLEWVYIWHIHISNWDRSRMCMHVWRYYILLGKFANGFVGHIHISN